jgi:hypothetical protein
MGVHGPLSGKKEQGPCQPAFFMKSATYVRYLDPATTICRHQNEVSVPAARRADPDEPRDDEAG